MNLYHQRDIKTFTDKQNVMELNNTKLLHEYIHLSGVNK